MARDAIITELDTGLSLIKRPYAAAGACGHIAAGNTVTAGLTILEAIDQAIATGTNAPSGTRTTSGPQISGTTTASGSIPAVSNGSGVTTSVTAIPSLPFTKPTIPLTPPIEKVS